MKQVTVQGARSPPSKMRKLIAVMCNCLRHNNAGSAGFAQRAACKWWATVWSFFCEFFTSRGWNTGLGSVWLCGGGYGAWTRRYYGCTPSFASVSFYRHTCNSSSSSKWPHVGKEGFGSRTRWHHVSNDWKRRCCSECCQSLSISAQGNQGSCIPHCQSSALRIGPFLSWQMWSWRIAYHVPSKWSCSNSKWFLLNLFFCVVELPVASTLWGRKLFFVWTLWFVCTHHCNLQCWYLQPKCFVFWSVSTKWEVFWRWSQWKQWKTFQKLLQWKEWIAYKWDLLIFVQTWDSWDFQQTQGLPICSGKGFETLVPHPPYLKTLKLYKTNWTLVFNPWTSILSLLVGNCFKVYI